MGSLVNVGRRSVVDEVALVRALTEGELRGAGLDVTSTEPLPDDSPLWDLPSMIITPHMGWSSDRLAERLADITVANARALCDGEQWMNRVVWFPLDVVQIRQWIMIFATGLGVPEGPVLMPDGGWLVVEMARDRGCVTRVGPDGQVREVLARSGRPNGLAVDSDGIIWIAESSARALLKLYPDGTVETFLTDCDGDPFLPQRPRVWTRRCIVPDRFQNSRRRFRSGWSCAAGLEGRTD